MSSTEHVYWILKAQIQAGKVERVKELAAQFCERARDEDGMLAYEWSVSEDGTSLHVYERYVDSDAALTHFENVAPHVGELLAVVKPTGTDCYGATSPAFRTAVEGYGMSYFVPIAGFHR